MRRVDPGALFQGLPTEPQVGIEPTTAPLSIVRGKGVFPPSQREKADFLTPPQASTAPFTVAPEGAKRNRTAIRVFHEVFSSIVARVRRWAQWKHYEYDARRIRTRQLRPQEVDVLLGFIYGPVRDWR